MPSSYPPTHFVPRAVINRSGVTYDPDRLEVLYAEDYHAIADELDAIETAIDEGLGGGSVGNLDGGQPDSNYGGIDNIDGGGV